MQHLKLILYKKTSSLYWELWILHLELSHIKKFLLVFCVVLVVCNQLYNMHGAFLVDGVVADYSGTSEERTIWEQRFCPLFRGCPYLGGSPCYCFFIAYTIIGDNCE